MEGKTPLMIAAQHGHLDRLLHLLDNCADARDATRDGALAIHFATMMGHLISCVKVLMPLTGEDALLGACYGTAKTADQYWLPNLRKTLAMTNRRLDLPSHGISVLHLAVRYNRIEILDYLLKSGVDPNLYVVKDHFMWSLPDTALGIACHMCNEEAVNVLLDAGARFHLGNNSVCDPALRAFCNPNCSREFVRFLVARGANHRAYCTNDKQPLFNFNRPDLLLEWMALGGCCANVHANFEDLIRYTTLNCPVWADGALMDVMFILAQFLPAANMRSLYGAVRSVLDIDGLALGRWKELWQILVTPRSLLEQCRAKTREVLMARDGYDLQRDIPKLDLPATLHDYLLFRES